MKLIKLKCANGNTAYVSPAHITHVMDLGPDYHPEVHLTNGLKLVVEHTAQKVYGALLRDEGEVS